MSAVLLLVVMFGWLLFGFETSDPFSLQGQNWPQTHSNTPSSSSQIQGSQLCTCPELMLISTFKGPLASPPVWSESSWNIKGFSFRGWVPGAHGKEENRIFSYVRPCSKHYRQVCWPRSHSKHLQSNTGSEHSRSCSKPSRENCHSSLPTQDAWKHSHT